MPTSLCRAQRLASGSWARLRIVRSASAQHSACLKIACSRPPTDTRLRAVLTVNQPAQLDTAGCARVPGVVDRAEARRMADAVWASLASRGIDRASASTWPSGFLGKHQGLRRAGAFDGFDTDRTTAIVDELLGPGTWQATGSWGPALVTFPGAGPVWTVPHKVWHSTCPAGGIPISRTSSVCSAMSTRSRPEAGARSWSRAVTSSFAAWWRPRRTRRRQLRRAPQEVDGKPPLVSRPRRDGGDRIRSS